ncbi:MAG: lipopolysaccharide biosynthesis protein, partial [Alphaproteobacteria bacterium]
LKAALVTAVDLTFVTISGLAIVLALYFPDHTNMATVFGLLAAGSIAGAMVGLILSRRRLRVTIRPKHLAHYLGPWRDTRWALAGVGIFTVQTRVHALIVAAALGPEAFAILAAGNILFGPIRMLIVAWGKITRPYLARAIGRDQFSKVSNANRLSFVALGVGFFVLFSGLYLFWSPIEEIVYRGKYENIGLVVVLWGSVSLLGACRNLLAIPLQSMLAFRQLAMLQTAGALTSLASVAILVTFADFRLSILGLALGEGINLILSWNLYRRQQAQLRRPRPISPGIPAQPLSDS